MADWVILGCGYTGSRLAKGLLAEGHRVRACARNLARLQPLVDLGAEVHSVDAAKLRSFGPAVYGMRQPYVVYSIPPVAGVPAGESLHRAGEAASAAGSERFIYLSSTGVYGETESGLVVDEDTPVAVGDPDAMSRIAEEGAVETLRLAGLSTVALRLAAIYGPGRGVRERLKTGAYKLLDDGMHWYSRVHVDDLCGVIRAAASRAQGGSLYCVADDRPATQREYLEWLTPRLGMAMPPSQASMVQGSARRLVRNRKISNAKLHRDLDYTFRYPSFVEGEEAIERELGTEAAATVAAPVSVAVPATIAAPVTVAAPIAVAGPVATPAPTSASVVSVAATQSSLFWSRAAVEDLADATERVTTHPAAALEAAERALAILRLLDLQRSIRGAEETTKLSPELRTRLQTLAGQDSKDPKLATTIKSLTDLAATWG